MQGSGKSTLLQKFSAPEKEDDLKATLALEYNFLRRAAKAATGVSKEVCHLWEIGSGPALASLLDVPLSENTVKNVLVSIVVDLSKPKVSGHEVR